MGFRRSLVRIQSPRHKGLSQRQLRQAFFIESYCKNISGRLWARIEPKTTPKNGLVTLDKGWNTSSCLHVARTTKPNYHFAYHSLSKRAPRYSHALARGRA